MRPQMSKRHSCNFHRLIALTASDVPLFYTWYMTEPINIASTIDDSLRTPGLLLEPFRWAAEPVMRLALAEPRLLAHLIDLNAVRMHVIALYLANRRTDADDGADAALLASGRARDIIAKA